MLVEPVDEPDQERVMFASGLFWAELVEAAVYVNVPVPLPFVVPESVSHV
jgi:hypothetical protein